MARRLVLGCAVLVFVACGSTPVEQQVLTQFFRAARVRDNTTLADMSAVNFDPRTDGSVQQFTIDSIGQQQHRALQLQQLTADQDKIRADQVEFTKKMRDFYQSNSVAIDRVSKAQKANQPVNGKDAELLATWTKWDSDSRDFERKLSQARQRVAKEKSVAAESLTPPGRDSLDLHGMDVDIITEPVNITAQVTAPDGKTTTAKPLVVTLQRASAKKGGQTTDGRWIIMAIEPQGGGAAKS
jgi:hypothetical protein